MSTEHELAKRLLNGVWQEDLREVRLALEEGADPNWRFNGYPILLHATFLENVEITNLLIRYGATQLSEALGFALERGLGRMIKPFAYLGVVPTECKFNHLFGPYPSRFTSITYQ